MKIPTSVRISTALVAGGMLAAFASPAFAAGNGTTTTSTATAGPAFNNRRAACEAAVQRRLTSINTTIGTVTSNTALTAADKTNLLNQINSDNAGLKALGIKIAGDTDPATLKSDCQSIVVNYRWYLLEIPKTRLVIAADTAGVAAGRLHDVSSRLQTDIDRAQAKGRNVAQAQADEAALNSEISSGQASAAQVPPTVLPLKAQSYLSGNEAATLQGARADIVTTRNDFEQARTDAKKVIADLRGPQPGPVTPTASS